MFESLLMSDGWCEECARVVRGVRRYTKNILYSLESTSNRKNVERLKPNKLCHQLDPTGGHCILDIMDTFLLTQHETCHGQTCEIRNCRFNTVLVLVN